MLHPSLTWSSFSLNCKILLVILVHFVLYFSLSFCLKTTFGIAFNWIAVTKGVFNLSTRWKDQIYRSLSIAKWFHSAISAVQYFIINLSECIRMTQFFLKQRLKNRKIAPTNLDLDYVTFCLLRRVSTK